MVFESGQPHACKGERGRNSSWEKMRNQKIEGGKQGGKLFAVVTMGLVASIASVCDWIHSRPSFQAESTKNDHC